MGIAGNLGQRVLTLLILAALSWLIYSKLKGDNPKLSSLINLFRGKGNVK